MITNFLYCWSDNKWQPCTGQKPFLLQAYWWHYERYAAVNDVLQCLFLNPSTSDCHDEIWISQIWCFVVNRTRMNSKERINNIPTRGKVSISLWKVAMHSIICCTAFFIEYYMIIIFVKSQGFVIITHGWLYRFPDTFKSW